ncbi:phytanoyl-CoA dioxygenase family protein [Xenorhabdus thuongxuanensis]|uniref:Phytanoyl-CoA dioxygenase n=1 Tax=Xenorhabdus thuongxuanensis TaxID=1873484 RepID=A0A1Q5U199_9GAMM|nr:phytanoyl-CoA dioxygenase family protein [Xenorhabdus thuongxuanensis]OKP06224.1 hypothetical protein Xentx_02194 [Xenorhabdus thuongxuanensis]
MVNIEILKEEVKLKGYAKIKGLFNPSELELLKKNIRCSEAYKNYKLNTEKQPPMTKAVKSSNLLFRNDGELLNEWLSMSIQKEKFKILSKIVEHNLIRTNDHVLEIAPNTHKGLDWHVGYYSFSYTQLEDYGCTLWVPLDNISRKQKGGMKYIPKNKLNGQFIYQFANYFFDSMRLLDPSEEYNKIATSDKFMINSVTTFIDDNVNESDIEDFDFDIGDAFLFDKNVIHKTSEFLTGDLKSRMAIIIRFVSKDSLFDKERFISIFKHLEKSSISATSSTAYFDVNTEDNNEIKPKDPFLSKLVPEKHKIKLIDSHVVRKDFKNRLFITK